MEKILDLSRNVHDLCADYPDLAEILAELGFKDISKPMALNTVGRVMTIPKGSDIKGIDLQAVVSALSEKGYTVVNDPAAEGVSSADERKELLRSYVQRLSDGEDLESVRSDFVANFSDVEAGEIAEAEQSLIESGVPISDVQKLCDVHSALFHGSTRTEKIQNAEKAVSESLEKKTSAYDSIEIDLDELLNDPTEKEGHPLQILTQENRAIEKQIARCREYFESENWDTLRSELEKLNQIGSHYGKKGDLLYPLLKTGYDVTGPSDVMWSVDDEIKAEIRAVSSAFTPENQEWKDRVDAVLTRADEMVYKEDHILLPICAENFTAEEWQQMYKDFFDYSPCLIGEYAKWEDADPSENRYRKEDESSSEEIILPSGHMTVEQLTAVLNTIPMEITFVDDQNMNRYFNDGEGMKLFKRPLMALDREVFTCHPPKVEEMVRGIIRQFREGTRDTVDVWMTKEGKPVLVRYMAVRDKSGKYLGTMECVQVMDEIQKHFQKG